MWPFRKKPPPDNAVSKLEQAVDKVFQLMNRLEAGDSAIEDEEIREAYGALASTLQSNCDSVAQGLLVVIASLCANRQHLTAELLPDAMDPLYGLAIENYDVLAGYFKWLADHDTPYLGTPTPSGRDYLLHLSDSEETLRAAFEVMYRKQQEEWGVDDDELLPKILRDNRSQ